MISKGSPMLINLMKKSYQLFWEVQQINLEMMAQVQETAIETHSELLKAAVKKNLDVLDAFAQKIQTYENACKNRPSSSNTFLSLLESSGDFFTIMFKNLTFSKKSLLKILRDQYLPQGFEMTKKIAKTCSLSLIGLMSSVSGRAINSESAPDYTVTSFNNKETISLPKQRIHSQTSTTALLEAKAQEARRQKNIKLRRAFVEAKQNLENQTSRLKALKIREWEENQQKNTPNTIEWYELEAEKYATYAEWEPDQAASYRREAERARLEAERLREQKERNRVEEEWKSRKAAVPEHSREWYELEAEKYDIYAKWYPDDADYYHGKAEYQRQQAVRAERYALEDTWADQLSTLPEESAEWYDVQIERSTRHADWEPAYRDYYLEEAERYRQQKATAPQRAERLRQEQDWVRIEGSLIYGSAEWYDHRAIVATTRADWEPASRDYYLEEAERCRRVAQAIRENEAHQAEIRRTEALRREEEERAAEAAREEEVRIAREQAELRSRLNPEWEADLIRARALSEEGRPVAAYEILKDRVFLFERYEHPLEAMRSGAALTPRNRAEKTAVKKAFWHKIHKAIEDQVSLNPDAEAGEQKYFNLLKFLTETQAPDIIIGADQINDDEWVELEGQTKQLAADVGFTEGDLTGAPSHWGPGANWITEWFSKLMGCAQAGSDSGKNFLRNRAKKIVEYLQELKHAADEDAEVGEGKNTDKIKLIIQKDIIDNAQNCADRALSGLDNAEVNIKLAKAETPEQALGVVVQKLKKSIIEIILDRRQQEIVEEYLYLALMFNKHLALGMPETEMLFARCGARKTFNEALGKILENVSYQGAVDMLLAEETWMEALKKLSPEYAEADTQAMEKRMTDTEALAEEEERLKAPIDQAFEAAKEAAEARKTEVLRHIAAEVEQIRIIEESYKRELAAAKAVKEAALGNLPEGDDDTAIFEAYEAAKAAADIQKAGALRPFQAQVDEIKRVQAIYDAEINAARAVRRAASNEIEDTIAERTEQIEAAYHTAIKSAADRLTKEIFDREFVVTGSKYAGITPEHIAQIEDAIRADNTTPEQLLERARAKLAELNAPTAAERERLERELHEDTEIMENIRILRERATAAEAELNEQAGRIMENADFWDRDFADEYPEMDDRLATYPAYAAAQRAYTSSHEAYTAATARDTPELRERIRTNQEALDALNIRDRSPEIQEIREEIDALERETRAPERGARFGWGYGGYGAGGHWGGAW